jgi:hypothetical protein
VHKDEFGEYAPPDKDEMPFHCLLSDDKLISRVSVETDTLLVSEIHKNYVRLIVTVDVRPYVGTMHNLAWGG